MKAIWKGNIVVGMVSIPVKLYSATNKKLFSFKLLCGECLTPIKYKRWCPKCNKEVVWEKVVKAVEVSKGKYIPLDKSITRKISSIGKKRIEIIGFVNRATITPLLYDNHYYVIPTEQDEKPYFLFKELLMLTNKLAFVRFVFKEREHIGVIDSYKSGLLLSTLHYSYEINDIDAFVELKSKPKITNKEIELGKELIKLYSIKEFDLEKYKDKYAEKLKLLLLGKLKDEGLVKKIPSKNVLDMIEQTIKARKTKMKK